jgi:hypothetical protein
MLSEIAPGFNIRRLTTIGLQQTGNPIRDVLDKSKYNLYKRLRLLMKHLADGSNRKFIKETILMSEIEYSHFL